MTSFLKAFCVVANMAVLLPATAECTSGNPKQKASTRVFLPIYMVTELSIQTRRDLSLLPRDYFMFGGLGASKTFIYSGEDFSFGGATEVKFGRCLTQERVYAFDVPFYLTVNYGALSRPDNEKKMGVSGGVGMDFYYCYVGAVGEERESFFRPAFFLQSALNVFDKPVFVRYSTLFSPGKLDKNGFQFGVYLII